MREFFIPVVLQLAGVIIIIAEIFLPSGGLLSLVAVGLFGYSLFIVFHDISTMAGTYFVLADLFIIPVLVTVCLKILARSPATLREALSSESGVISQSPELEKFMGREGTSITVLHPGGTAMIDGKRVDVVSRGEYIEKNSNLIVVEVTANQIIVRENKSI
ncbi:MAG: serine protease [Deltaproteobacteria bacterium]|jgi:membrane-bound serine protease (ClpP class)|nr:serine protease [Deltaproteobacteria bacterium]